MGIPQGSNAAGFVERATIRRQGARLEDMSDPQREAVADWEANQAGVEWWHAQSAAQRGETLRAASHMRVSDQLRAHAAQIRSTLS